MGEQFVNGFLGDRMNLIGALWVIPLALLLLAVVARLGPATGHHQPKTIDRR
jgi:hypothetical protein